MELSGWTETQAVRLAANAAAMMRRMSVVLKVATMPIVTAFLCSVERFSAP